MPKRLLFLLKLLVTVGILGAILTQLDLSVFRETFLQAWGAWLGLALLFNVLAIVTSTLKWDALLRGLNQKIGLWELAQLYTIGFFVSSFLPGVIGGDAVRWHLAAKRTGNRIAVAASVLAERITGVVALITMCAVSLLLVPEFVTPTILLFLGGACVATIAGLAVAMNRWLVIGIIVLLRRFKLCRLARICFNLYASLRKFSWRTLSTALAWSIVFYLAGGGVLFMICEAFGASVSIQEAIAEQSYVCLLAMIPISLGGLGLIQAGDIYFFNLLGVAAATAFGISIARQLIGYAFALIGAIFFLGWHGDKELRTIRESSHSSASQVRSS